MPSGWEVAVVLREECFALAGQYYLKKPLPQLGFGSVFVLLVFLFLRYTQSSEVCVQHVFWFSSFVLRDVRGV